LVVLGMAYVLALPTARPVFAAGTVGTGTAASCTEAALNAALVGGGLVRFNCGSSPVTITLTAQKVITLPTQIDGGGLVTLSGGNAVRHFQVNAGATLQLDNLTLRNGRVSSVSGGAITNGGTLLISNTVIFSNTAVAGLGPAHGGAIYNGGTLVMTNSLMYSNTTTGNGGAIENANVVRLTNVGVYSNVAGVAGGGVYVGVGTYTMTGGVLNNNRANSGNGGGLYVFTGTLSIVSATVNNNFALSGGTVLAASSQWHPERHDLLQ
jgi:hypothetical protein